MNNMYLRNRLVFLVLVTLSLWGAPGSAATQLETTVEHLIGQVAASGLTFVRNDKPHSSDEAARHMRKKYQHFQDEIDTPEAFIEFCATRSLLSGKPYLVVDDQGKEMRTADWLLQELRHYREQRQQGMAGE